MLISIVLISLEALPVPSLLVGGQKRMLRLLLVTLLLRRNLAIMSHHSLVLSVISSAHIYSINCANGETMAIKMDILWPMRRKGRNGSSTNHLQVVVVAVMVTIPVKTRIVLANVIIGAERRITIVIRIVAAVMVIILLLDF